MKTKTWAEWVAIMLTCFLLGAIFWYLLFTAAAEQVNPGPPPAKRMERIGIA